MRRFAAESGSYTGYRKFTLVTAYAWNLMQLCTLIVLGITYIQSTLVISTSVISERKYVPRFNIGI